MSTHFADAHSINTIIIVSGSSNPASPVNVWCSYQSMTLSTINQYFLKWLK